MLSGVIHGTLGVRDLVDDAIDVRREDVRLGIVFAPDGFRGAKDIEALREGIYFGETLGHGARFPPFLGNGSAGKCIGNETLYKFT